MASFYGHGRSGALPNPPWPGTYHGSSSIHGPFIIHTDYNIHGHNPYNPIYQYGFHILHGGFGRSDIYINNATTTSLGFFKDGCDLHSEEPLTN